MTSAINALSSNCSSLRRFAVPVVLVLLTSLWALPVVAHDPPKNLKKVGDHWTAWDPPTDLPADAEVHIIEPGDTLWDLAERFLGNPYLWPQIWERNSYVLDAHWIYPGDPLVMGLRIEPQESLEMTAQKRSSRAPAHSDVLPRREWPMTVT